MTALYDPGVALDYGALLHALRTLPEAGPVQHGCVVYPAESLVSAIRTAWGKARAYDSEHHIPNAAELRPTTTHLRPEEEK